jgi:hypothetical protein
MWVRVRSTGAARVTSAMMRMSAPQLRQVSGRDSNSRVCSRQGSKAQLGGSGHGR